MIPYAFIHFSDEPINGIDRVKQLIIKSGSDPSWFTFQQFDHLPDFLTDSFSMGFLESATRLGKGVSITVAQPKLTFG